MTVDQEVEQLLAAATAPLAPASEAVPARGKALAHLRAFFSATGVRGGSTPSVEVCTLYKFYRSWLDQALPGGEPLPPQQFSVLLKAEGFRRSRRRPVGSRGVDKRFLEMHRAAAAMLLEWSSKNPTTPAERALFDPKIRWRKHAAPAAGEAAGEAPAHDAPDAGVDA